MKQEILRNKDVNQERRRRGEGDVTSSNGDIHCQPRFISITTSLHPTRCARQSKLRSGQNQQSMRAEANLPIYG